jgi:hypothetical protein
MTKPKQTALERVHSHLRQMKPDGPPISVQDIVTALGMPVATVRTAALELTSRGHVAQVILRESCGRLGGEKVGYCLPGHPMIAETKRIRERQAQRREAAAARRGNKVVARALCQRTALEQVWR